MDWPSSVPAPNFVVAGGGGGGARSDARVCTSMPLRFVRVCRLSALSRTSECVCPSAPYISAWISYVVFGQCLHLLHTNITRCLVVSDHLAASSLGNDLGTLHGRQDLLGLLKVSFPLRSMMLSPKPCSAAPVSLQATVQATPSCGQHSILRGECRGARSLVVILAFAFLNATI